MKYKFVREFVGKIKMDPTINVGLVESKCFSDKTNSPSNKRVSPPTEPNQINL